MDNLFSKTLIPDFAVIKADRQNRKDKDFFWYSGTHIYVGRQGSGKTVTLVKHAMRIKKRYPKAILVSNLKLKSYQPTTDKVLLYEQPDKYYLQISDMDSTIDALLTINNGKYGVMYIIDEIHTYFNSIESRNIPIYIFTEISQQRKQRKLILGSSQLFLRMAKPFREQATSIILNRTLFGKFTINRLFFTDQLKENSDGQITGRAKKVGFYFHTKADRAEFDTFQKVISAEEQYYSSAPTLKMEPAKKQGFFAKK